MTPEAIALIVCAAVGLIAFGVVLEIEGSDSAFDALPFIIPSPMCVAAAAVFCEGWCALWIVRGPVRLAITAVERRRLRAQRADLPRAEMPQARLVERKP